MKWPHEPTETPLAPKSRSNVHRVQSYSRDKTDWTVQLAYSRENSADIGLEIPIVYRYRQKYSNIATGGKIRKDILETTTNLLCYKCVYAFPKKLLLTDKRRKMPFSLFPRPNNTVSNNFYV